jgi:hypothetical protein
MHVLSITISSRLKVFAPGTVAEVQGQRASHLYCLLGGACSVVKYADRAAQVTVNCT